MKTDIKDVAPCRKMIEVDLPVETVNTAFDDIYNTLQNQVQVKGFRRGHAPRKLLERKFAKDVAKDVSGKLFQDSFVKCMKENDLAPLGDPDIDIDSLEAKAGEPFKYSLEVDVRPSFEIPEYKGLELEEKVEAVEDKDIDEQLKSLCERFGSYNPVEEGAVVQDMLEADILIKSGDEEIVNQEAQRIRVEGTNIFGIEYEKLEKDLSGLKAGDEKTLKTTLSDTYHKEDLRGKKAEINVKVKSVLRAELPEINDEFAARLGMPDVAALRKQISSNIESERRSAAQRQLEDDVTTKLIEACSFELPEKALEKQREQAWQSSRMNFARMGATAEWLDENEEEFRKASDEDAEKQMRRQIIFDAIADKEEMEITEAELQTHIEMLARSYQTTPAKMMKRIQELNGFPQMASELRDIKVMRLILDAAKIKRDSVEDKEEDK